MSATGKTSLTSRLGAWAALSGGALSIAQGTLVLSNPDYYGFDSLADNLVLVVEGVVLVLLLVGLAGLHARQFWSYGRLGMAGFLAALVGTVLAGAGHIFSVPFFDFVGTGGLVYVLFALVSAGIFLFGGMVYVAGVVSMSLGYLLLGFATVRARVLPVWCGAALVFGIVGLWLGNEVGWLSFGVAWLGVGYAMLRTKSG